MSELQADDSCKRLGGRGSGVEPARADGLEEKLVVAVGLFGVTDGKLDEGGVELVAGAEIACNASSVTGAGLSAGESPTTNTDIFKPIGFAHVGKIELHFHIAELTKVEMMALVIVSPAKENVAGRLEHTLAGNNALAMIGVATFASVRLKDGGEGLFELEKQGSVVVADKQGDIAAGADTADTDDFAGDVDNLVAIKKNAALVGESGAITAKHFDDMLANEVGLARVIDERRMIDDASAAVFYHGDLRDDVFAGILTSFGFNFAPAFLGGGSLGFADEFVGVDVGVPNVEGVHFGKTVNVFAVGAGQEVDGVFTLAIAQPDLAKTENDAGGEAFQVPFPGSGESLIKIVDVKNQAALGTGESTEVGSVAIATGLHADASGGSFGKVPGHYGGGTTIKGEG